VKRFIADHPDDATDTERDAGLIALALLARQPEWRGGNGLVVFTRDEVERAARLLDATVRAVLVPSDRAGRDAVTENDVTHMRVDLLQEAPR
jgi:hypothetical protein